MAVGNSENYTRVIKAQIERAGAADLINMLDRTLLAFELIRRALQERYPTEYAAWNDSEGDNNDVEGFGI